MHRIKINNQTLIIGIAAGAALIAIGFGLFFAKEHFWPTPAEPVMGEPIDVVLDYYNPWLEAVQATTTTPFKEGYAKSTLLSPELRKQINAQKNYKFPELDPVLCQTGVPTQITARLVSQTDAQAQVLVVSRDKAVTNQAIVTLTALNGGWYMSGIQCSPGEFAPEREFSFDTEGFLLKSVVPPLDPKYWHLVFEQNGVQGYTVPLFFSADSKCVAVDGTESVCDQSTFVEPSKAKVQGEMTETGVKVKRLTHEAE